MSQEVFKANAFVTTILPAIVTVALLVIPVLMAIFGRKEKLTIEDG